MSIEYLSRVEFEYFKCVDSNQLVSNRKHIAFEHPTRIILPFHTYRIITWDTIYAPEVIPRECASMVIQIQALSEDYLFMHRVKVTITYIDERKIKRSKCIQRGGPPCVK